MIIEFVDDNIYKTVEELEKEIGILQAYINGKQSRIDYLKTNRVLCETKQQAFEKRKVMFR